ncbi:hypothetical protein KSB_78190 [Ktedonobacter robiniae]|uniref:Uncharacterized protein n=1 Tax=Ktedonobacter robiniae TaxID=2778365 RepID=A0ABQ3V2F9_9CHLR|nr:hypothetical protein KSB_78190 [Ktedonobacter robiniae]
MRQYRSGTSVVCTKVLADRDGGGGTLTGRADQLLGASGAYVARGENALDVRLEVRACPYKTLGIGGNGGAKWLAIGLEADKDKGCGRMQFLLLPTLRVFDYKRRDAIILPLNSTISVL